MFITNELVRSAIIKTPSVVKSSFKDVETFSRDAHKDILNSIHDGINTATERIKYDLESKLLLFMKLFGFSSRYSLTVFILLLRNKDVDKLLGDQIQKNIESDSGLKITLESILGICSGMGKKNLDMKDMIDIGKL